MGEMRHKFNPKKPELGGLLYDGKVPVDYENDKPRWAVVLPGSTLDQWKWGWKQDCGKQWYREIAPGQDIWREPDRTGQTPPPPTTPYSWQIILGHRPPG
jgi:hypothetical protein